MKQAHSSVDASRVYENPSTMQPVKLAHAPVAFFAEQRDFPLLHVLVINTLLAPSTLQKIEL